MGRQISIYLGKEDEKNLLGYIINQGYDLVYEYGNPIRLKIINAVDELSEKDNYKYIYNNRVWLYCFDVNRIQIIKQMNTKNSERLINTGFVQIIPGFIKHEEKTIRVGRIYSRDGTDYTEEQNASIKEVYYSIMKWIKKNVSKRKFKTKVLSIDGSKIIENYEINSYMSDEIYDMLANQGYISYI